jgi:hypothetical protein
VATMSGRHVVEIICATRRQPFRTREVLVGGA